MLIHGASGAVGLAAVQIAKAHGMYGTRTGFIISVNVKHLIRKHHEIMYLQQRGLLINTVRLD